MAYLYLKHLHMTAAGLSLLFFVVRAYWSVSGSPLLQAKLVRVLPHVIDTIFLGCGLALAAMLGAAASQPWLLTKIVLLLVYIGVGSIAIKYGRSPGRRAVAAVAAVLIFLYIVGVAIRHHPMSWFYG